MKNYLATISITTWICAAAAIAFATTTSIGYSKLTDATTHASELQASLSSTTIALEASEFEKAELIQKLSQKETDLEELAKKYKKLDKKTDDLQKLTRTDKELLEKYSKVYFLNEHYIPSKVSDIPSEFLSNTDRGIQIHSEVLPYIEDMINDAKEDGVTLTIASGYRSYETQKSLKSAYTVTYGAGTANQFSADQGYSEHQLGTTIDITTPGSGLTISFEKTEAFKWLVDHAYRYGFVLSYPKGNAYYQYEPWHWRFVGKDLARKLHREEKYFYDYDQRQINEYLLDFFD